MTKREVEEYIMSQIFPNASHEVTAQNVRNAFAPIVERVWTFLEGEIGDLTQLQTADKQSVVNAINAVLTKMKTDIDKENADIATLGSKVGELESEIIGSETKTQLTPFRTHANYYISASGGFSFTQYWGGSTDVYKVQEGDIVEISGNTTAKGTDGRQINNTLWVTATAEGLNANYNKRLGTTITEETTVKERITIESGETFLKIANGINVIVQSISKGESLDDKLAKLSDDIADRYTKEQTETKFASVESVDKIDTSLSNLSTSILGGDSIKDTYYAELQVNSTSRYMFYIPMEDFKAKTIKSDIFGTGNSIGVGYCDANKALLTTVTSYTTENDKFVIPKKPTANCVYARLQANSPLVFTVASRADLVEHVEGITESKQDKLTETQMGVLNSGVSADDVASIDSMKNELFAHEEITERYTAEAHPTLSGKFVVYVAIDYKDKTVYCDTFRDGDTVQMVYCTADKAVQTSAKNLTVSNGSIVIPKKPAVQDVLARLYSTSVQFTSESVVYEKQITESLNDRKQDKLTSEQMYLLNLTNTQKIYYQDACSLVNRMSPVLGITGETIFAFAPDAHFRFDDIINYHTLYYRYSDTINKQCKIFCIAGDIMFGPGEKTISYVKSKLSGDYVTMLDALTSVGLSPLMCLGGHDFNNISSNIEKQYAVNENLTKEEQRSLIIQPAIDRMNNKDLTVYISDSANVCYYYVDDSVSKTRYIFLDETDHIMSVTSGVYDADLYGTVHYSNSQLQWLIQTLNSVTAGYKIVMFNHTGVTDLNGVDGTREALKAIITAYVDRATYSGSGSGWSVSADFTSASGLFVALFKGHTHRISQTKIDNKWWQICSSNAGSHATHNARTTVMNNAIDGDIFHLDTDRYLHAFHYGRRGMYLENEVHKNIATMTSDRWLDGSLRITE